MLNFYYNICLHNTSGMNVCCMSTRTDKYKLVESYPNSKTFKMEYCGKEIAFNWLCSAADDFNFDFDNERRGGKSFLFVHLLSEAMLRKTLYIVRKVLDISTNSKFSQCKKVILFSRKNGVACMRWWKEKNSRPDIYSIPDGYNGEINFNNMNRSLLQKECFVNKGDILRVQVSPQINIQEVEGGEKIYHLQFLLIGHIVRGNALPQYIPMPPQFEIEEDPLEFMK